jgi:hypothetical protein
MKDVLLDPITAIAFLVTLIAAIAVGRTRREPWIAIAMTVVGVNAFLIGVHWAGIIGGDAATAVWLAAGGMAIWGEAVVISARRTTPARS